MIDFEQQAVQALVEALWDRAEIDALRKRAKDKGVIDR